MSELTLQGTVLSAMPIGEYDRRVVLLTKERGKISAFAKGARRQGNPLMAAASPFVFGTFTVYEGRSSYTLRQVSIDRQFMDLPALFPGVYYGYYFMEIADYFGQEGVEEKDMLNLLYVALGALVRQQMDCRLIRSVFELRSMGLEGMMPSVFRCTSCGKSAVLDDPELRKGWHFSFASHGVVCETCARRFLSSDCRLLAYSTVRAMQYILSAPLTKLFAFSVSPQTMEELGETASRYMAMHTDRPFKSLSILEGMERGIHKGFSPGL